MARPTPEEGKEMQYRRLIKEIWEKNLNRSINELSMSYDQQFLKIKTQEKEIDIHRSFFEDYFAASGSDSKKSCLERIKLLIHRSWSITPFHVRNDFF